jgi:hypothetical protein
MDVDFPTLLGAELFRPDGSYIAKFVIQPNVVHDFNQTPGASVQLDRYGFFQDGDQFFTEDSRRRLPTQAVGTDGSREMNKTKIILTLDDFTGPAAGGSDPTAPGNLKIPVATIIRAQRMLYDLGNPAAFHQSIGSLTLIQDYRKWQDRVYINRLLEASAQGASSSAQGGYYNPRGVLNGGTYANGPAKFDIVNDLLSIVADARKRHVPPFSSPYGPVYHMLVDPMFLKDLRANSDFREVAKYPGAVPVSMLQPGAMPMSAPMMPAPGQMGNFVSAPNQLLFGGGGYGQVGFMSGDVMPTGFVFEGVRFFESTNLPNVTVNMNYTAAPPGVTTGASNRTGALGIMVGQQAVGEGVWSMGPEVALNENSDYKRFIIAIWKLTAGYVLLNQSFVTIARSFQN